MINSEYLQQWRNDPVTQKLFEKLALVKAHYAQAMMEGGLIGATPSMDQAYCRILGRHDIIKAFEDNSIFMFGEEEPKQEGEEDVIEIDANSECDRS
ncbi:MAG: hypothetical protein ACYDBV_14680 [Nitrospiria bacterium]